MSGLGKRIALVDYDDDQDEITEIKDSSQSQNKETINNTSTQPTRPTQIPKSVQNKLKNNNLAAKVGTTKEETDEDEENEGILTMGRSHGDVSSYNDRYTKDHNSKPVKKLISYDSLGIVNPVKTLLQGSLNTQQAIEEAVRTNDTRKRKIEFDTVSGKRQLVIDEPREKIWKSKKETREPYYYKAMKEIYYDRIAGSENPTTIQDEIPEIGEKPQYSVVNIGGKQETVREISQGDLIQFDYAKYKEQMERKDELLEDKLKYLRGNTAEANHAKNMIRAMELLDKEATQEATGVGKTEGMRRNKKQYGF